MWKFLQYIFLDLPFASTLSDIKIRLENCAQAVAACVVLLRVRDDISQSQETIHTVLILLYILISKFLMAHGRIKFLNRRIKTFPEFYISVLLSCRYGMYKVPRIPGNHLNKELVLIL